MTDLTREMIRAWERRAGMTHLPILRPYYAMAGNAYNAFHVTGKGNIVTGVEVDDLAGDASFGYAKGDFWLPVPLQNLTSFPNAPTLARTSQGIYTAALTTNTTQNVVVPLTGMGLRTFTGAPVASAPHGLKVNALLFNYTVATLGATSLAVAFVAEVQTNATARALVTNPFGSGAVTYQNPPGTTVANPAVATQATPYVTLAVPGTPAFFNTLYGQVFAEITVVMPNTSVVTLTEVAWLLSVAMY